MTSNSQLKGTRKQQKLVYTRCTMQLKCILQWLLVFLTKKHLFLSLISISCVLLHRTTSVQESHSYEKYPLEVEWKKRYKKIK